VRCNEFWCNVSILWARHTLILQVCKMENELGTFVEFSFAPMKNTNLKIFWNFSIKVLSPTPLLLKTLHQSLSRVSTIIGLQQNSPHKPIWSPYHLIYFIFMFKYESLLGSFFYLHVTREKLLKRRSYKKFVQKMLMKLTPGYRLVPSSFWA